MEKDYRNGWNTPEMREKLRAAYIAALDKMNGTTDAKAWAPTIAPGNRKTHIPSISLPPVLTCPKCCRGTCDAKCYAAKLCALYPSCATSYGRNLAAWTKSPAVYFATVAAACVNARFFRYHVAGDIPNAAYFAGMVETAKSCSATRFLCFTKNYMVVNNWIAANGGTADALPENLQLLFSGWSNLQPENPYKLPETTVYNKDAEPAPDWNLCGGNCLECACRGVGC